MLPTLKKYPQLVIAITAAAFFLPGLGAVHLFDRDELNFAEIAREMVVSGDWSRPTIGFEPFNEKPPMFAWLQAASMTLFSVDEFAARLPDALCGIATLLVLYRIGRRIHGERFGWLWVLAYGGSFLPQLYFHSGIIDPWFNLFTFLGVDALARCAHERTARWSALGGLWLGLAVLTKGPAAIIIVGLTIMAMWAWQRFTPLFRVKDLLLSLAVLIAVVGLWFGFDMLRHGPGFAGGFIQRQIELFTMVDADHGGFMGYHFIVLLVGCFPASLFALQEMLRPSAPSTFHLPPSTILLHRRWMLALFWVVLLLFTIVRTKIVHYSSLCYFPLTFLAALQLERIVVRNEAFGWSRYAVGIVGNVMASLVIALPLVMMKREVIASLFATDPFALASLRAEVEWTWYPMLTGLWLLAVLGLAHLLHQRRAHAASVIALFGGTALFVPIALYFFIGRIEAHSQRASVEFFQEHASERCWLMAKGYGSYVPEFYGRISEVRPDIPELHTGRIDRTVYLSSKITDADVVKEMGTFREIGRKNGFVFWRRDP